MISRSRSVEAFVRRPRYWLITITTLLHQAWAPLVRGFHFDHPAITALAHKYSKEPAQILLRYSLQKVRCPPPPSLSS